ncbi:uncharacterized protein [Amphiura filiformis]|uniref:uncharacterized protein n=1 Tax=Amphiura filiformis TaxID=82378 RepID=UPI003B21DB54
MATAIDETGKDMNLKLNVRKTKLLVAEAVEKEYNITIDGEKVEQVDHFKYLGSVKTSNANCTADIKARIGMSKGSMIELQDLWNDRNLPTELKMKLIKILVWSVLLYGLEGWTMTKADENRVLAAEMWFWRRMLNISWKEKRTNRSILEELGMKRQLLGELVTVTRKLTYLGDILRGSGSALTLQIIEGKVEGRSWRGRQKKQWFDNIKEWTGMNLVQAKRLAQNRTAWKEIWRCSQMVANRQ